MRKQFSRIALAASFTLALALTFSCGKHGSEDDGDDLGNIASSSSALLSSANISSSGGVILGPLVNYEGETYETVVIGSQTWLKRNLNYNASGSKCYNNDLANCTKYGRLYERETAISACPSGFHLPTIDEWKTLVSFVEKDKGCTDCAGKHLKAKSGWNDDFFGESGNGLDSYGFSALPGGLYSDGSFSGDDGDFGYWWSSNPLCGNNSIVMRNLVGDSKNSIGIGVGCTGYLLSVRCLQGTVGVSSSSNGNFSSSSYVILSSSSGGNSSSSGNIFVGENGEFTDSRDKQTYKWAKIGTQIWMAQNLNYHEEWIGPTRGNKCYDNQDENCEEYGRLYEWDDAIRICPDGWHLPSRNEWNALISFVGTDAGKKLKSISSNWRDSAGTDDYGFGALPSGELDQGEFKDLHIGGYWWTSTESQRYGTSWVKYIKTSNEVEEIDYYGASIKTNQNSVRCVKGYSSSSSIVYGEDVVDKRDGKTYKTVKIGNQIWMAENLNFAGKGVCYNGAASNCDKYGRLYDWATAMDVSEGYNTELLDAPPGYHQGICMDGWHLATRGEWDVLISFVGTDVGKKLKARNSSWNDDYGTDIYGFRALPGGILTDEFEQLNIQGYWWTSTESSQYGTGISWIKYINANNEVGETNYYGASIKTNKNSVRCVKD